MAADFLAVPQWVFSRWTVPGYAVHALIPLLCDRMRSRAAYPARALILYQASAGFRGFGLVRRTLYAVTKLVGAFALAGLWGMALLAQRVVDALGVHRLAARIRRSLWRATKAD